MDDGIEIGKEAMGEDVLAHELPELFDGVEVRAGVQARHKANPVSRLPAGIPGIGPIIAFTLATQVNPTRFRSGRHFAAWLGLTPRQSSSGGKRRLGGIGRQGNERPRQLLVVGAMSVIRFAKPGSKTASAWPLDLPNRRPRKVAAVALANKMARVAWAMTTSGEAYRATPQTARAARRCRGSKSISRDDDQTIHEPA